MGTNRRNVIAIAKVLEYLSPISDSQAFLDVLQKNSANQRGFLSKALRSHGAK